MKPAPTRGAVEDIQSGWVERPAVAFLIRVALFVAPVIVGWLAVRFSKDWYWQPAGWTGVALWVTQATGVAGTTSYVATRLAERLTPLSALFRLTLVFPDQAPSRLGIALRSGTLKKLANAHSLSGESDQENAEHAVTLITQLGKHERLTRGHTERVRARAELIGAEMGLGEQDLQKLRWGVLLHDIGKLSVPAAILDKDSQLTNDEWAIMREHPAEGARIVAPLAGWLGEWVEAAGQHHERWDGTGYPNGLSGTDISLAGRITAVADAYDVITSKRSYKEAMSAAAARKELVRCAGGQFDPVVVRSALQVGLRESNRVGLAGWLLELPAVARFAAAVPTAAVAASAAVVLAASFAGGGAPAPTSFPEAMAMTEMELEEVGSTQDAGGSELTTTTRPVAPTTTLVGASGEPTIPVVESAVVSTTEPVATSVAVSTTTATTTASPSSVKPATTTTTTTTPKTTTTSVKPATTTTTTTTPKTTTTSVKPATTTTTTTTTTVPVPPTPTGTGIAVLSGPTAPDDLSNNSLESNTVTYVIQEDQLATLVADVVIASYIQGQQTVANTNATTTIPAGTVVCSWFVRFEPTTNAPDPTNVSPSINFRSPILGLALSATQLSGTDELAIDGVNYAVGDVGSTDNFTVTGSELSLLISSKARGLDQLRVITAC